jgi:hypothetical protein
VGLPPDHPDADPFAAAINLGATSTTGSDEGRAVWELDGTRMRTVSESDLEAFFAYLGRWSKAYHDKLGTNCRKIGRMLDFVSGAGPSLRPRLICWTSVQT